MKKRRELPKDPGRKEIICPTHEELEEGFARLIAEGVPGAETEYAFLVGERGKTFSIMLHAFTRGALIGPVYERLREVMYEIQIPRRVAMRMRNERS